MIKKEDILVLHRGIDTYLTQSEGVMKETVKSSRQREFLTYPIVIVMPGYGNDFNIIKDRYSGTVNGSKEEIRKVLEGKKDRRILLAL